MGLSRWGKIFEQRMKVEPVVLTPSQLVSKVAADAERELGDEFTVTTNESILSWMTLRLRGARIEYQSISVYYEEQPEWHAVEIVTGVPGKQVIHKATILAEGVARCTGSTKDWTTLLDRAFLRLVAQMNKGEGQAFEGVIDRLPPMRFYEAGDPRPRVWVPGEEPSPLDGTYVKCRSGTQTSCTHAACKKFWWEKMEQETLDSIRRSAEKGA